MPTKPTLHRAGGALVIGSQADTRYLDTYFDGHIWTRGGRLFPNGRPWTGYREFSAEKGRPDGFVTAELMRGEHVENDREATLASAWDAPWAPESRYFEFDHQRKRIKLRYDKVIGDLTFAQNTYYKAAAKISNQNGWQETGFGQLPRFQITALIGDPPQSPRIPQAAQAGDPWLLGFDDEANPELARLLGVSSIADGMFNGTIARREAVVQPSTVLSMTADDLEAKIAAAVASALAAQQAVKDQRGQRMRDAKARKHVPSATPDAAR